VPLLTRYVLPSDYKKSAPGVAVGYIVVGVLAGVQWFSSRRTVDMEERPGQQNQINRHESGTFQNKSDVARLILPKQGTQCRCWVFCSRVSDHARVNEVDESTSEGPGYLFSLSVLACDHRVYAIHCQVCIVPSSSRSLQGLWFALLPSNRHKHS